MRAKHPVNYSLKDQLQFCPLAAKLNLTGIREEVKEIRIALKQAEKVIAVEQQEGQDAVVDSKDAFKVCVKGLGPHEGDTFKIFAN